MNRLFQFRTICFLVIMLSIWGCQREDEIPLEELPTVKRMLVTAQDIPDVKNTLLQKMGMKSDGKLYSSNNGEQTNELSIDWDHIKQLVDTAGRETYTFGVADTDPDPRIFYNLIIRYNEDHEAHQPFLLRYKMDEDFLSEYLQTGSLESFRGTTQKIPIRSTSSTPQRSRAFLDGDIGGISVDDPCPDENPINGGGGGSDPSTGSGPTYDCYSFLVTTTWYSQTCTRSGCEDPVEIGEEQSIVTECGWTSENNAAGTDDPCNPETGEIPIVEPLFDLSNPCKLKKLIEENPEIASKLLQLKGQTSLSKEVGYVMTKNPDGSFSFQYIQGEENQHEIAFTHNGNISGLMHTHFSGGLSVPSDFDIRSLYATLDHMDNPRTYLFGVVTWQQTVYLLTINSTTDFRAFGDRYLADGSAWFAFFAEKFRLKISNDNTIAENETNLVKLLSEFNTGLSLVRGDASTMNNWTKLTENSDGSIKEKQCR